MLKKFGIFAVLLIFTPMMPGQPNKAVDQNKKTAEQNPPPLTPTDSNNNQFSGQGQGDQAKAGPSTPQWYTSLERPDWWLVMAAFSTLGVVCWQSMETRKAAQGALLSAQASMAQVEHSKSVQRAQLRIEFADPEFSYNGKGYPVHFCVNVDGTTRAYVLDESILAYVNESKRTGTMRRGLAIPRHVIPEESPFEGHTLIHIAERVAHPEPDMNDIYSARRGELTLFVEGHIRYRDIFGDEWLLSIDRYWDSTGQMWGPVGSGQGDTHRKTGA
jgi:hypothetical protein